MFSAGEAVELERLCSALEVSYDELGEAVLSLKGRLEAEGRGIRLIEVGDCVQLCSAPEYVDFVRRAIQLRKQLGLSAAALETLSIIAYNQPVTKGKIEFIRGVDCSHSVTRLLERGFIDEAGRAEAPGRPILYVTTMEFLRCFGLKDLSELPPLPEKAPAPTAPSETGEPDVLETFIKDEAEKDGDE